MCACDRRLELSFSRFLPLSEAQDLRHQLEQVEEESDQLWRRVKWAEQVEERRRETGGKNGDEYDQFQLPDMPAVDADRLEREDGLADFDGRHVNADSRPQFIPSMPLGPPLQLKHNHRQKAVVDAFRHAWKAYRLHAWGKDELKPVSR